MDLDSVLSWVCSSVTGLAGLLCALAVLPSGLLPRPTGGERGYRRRQALDKAAALGWLEITWRAAGHRMGALPLPGLRLRLEQRLENAGRPWGLGADELLGLCLMSGSALAGLGAFASALSGKPTTGPALAAALFGAALPLFRVDELVRQRRLTVSRSLPAVIDLIALSMEAGLDFNRAVTQVQERLNPGSPLRFELEHLRHKLALGWSRQNALEDMAKRIPTPPVRQFATAVVQGERRGTPLAEVLSTQAQVMRTKRSQAAEQAASRAGVLILLPLLLIFSAVFVVLLGPFVVKLLRGELM